MANAAAQTWLDELRADPDRGKRLPVAIETVAPRARTGATKRLNGDAIARARVRTPSGRWLLVRGSMLGDEPGARAAAILEARAQPSSRR